MKTKRIMASVASAIIVASGGLNAYGSAVLADATSPTLYIDITYETADTIRADIMLSNFPEFANGGFLVNYDDGWEPVINSHTHRPSFTTSNCTGRWANSVYVGNNSDSNLFPVVFASIENQDFNGRFLSVYFTKNSNYSQTNSNINISFENGAEISTYNGLEIVSSDDPDSYIAPEITQVSEYMIGDLDGDNHIDATDASAVLAGLNTAGVHNISPRAIENNYHNFFPDALAPAAPDADKSGLINSADAASILDFYGSVMTNDVYEGQIGSMDIYEYYNN